MQASKIVVIGGGHAGIEAAHTAASLGVPTTMITLQKNRIGHMSCNPAIGGVAKGHMVREIDALGGLMGETIDKVGIQFRILNSRKGPAVRSPRAQADKALYSQEMLRRVLNTQNLDVIEGEVHEILWKDGVITGVRLGDQSEVSCSSVIITAGTFLRAKMFIGEKCQEGGRVGDRASSKLSEQLLSLGLELGRFKTGTPPRLKSESIDWAACEEQKGDENPKPFSHFTRLSHFPHQKQISCAITYTNKKTKQIIQDNIERSPLFSGVIEGLGPRYCPSIEDKVVRFSDKDSHQIFLEPEGLDTNSVYINGVSTSLPEEVQIDFLRSVPGLESVQLIRPGYAVEYDYILSRQLERTLELRDCKGLYFAGQVNGTSGYEEAAAQGLVAGANAALAIQNREPFELSREDSYIGVLIDDLIVKGTEEPYRMFTSRAENRLFLRADNANERLCQRGYDLGLLGGHKWEAFQAHQDEKKDLLGELEKRSVFHVEQDIRWLDSQKSSPVHDRASYRELLKRPEIRLSSIIDRWNESSRWNPIIVESVEVEEKYKGYLDKENRLNRRIQKAKDLRIPCDMKFSEISGLSREVVELLEKYRPDRLASARKIPGITPAALAVLGIYLKSKKKSPREPTKKELRKKLLQQKTSKGFQEIRNE